MALNAATDKPYTTLSQQAYDVLLDEIVGGTLAPGIQLNRQSLAKRLGMSSIPVLEALRLLEKDGLVECPPKWPARVRIQDAEFVRGEYVLREALESQAARRCTETATEEQLAALAEMAPQVDDGLIHHDMESATGWQTHLKFHTFIAQASGCAALAQKLDLINLRLIIRRNWKRVAYDANPEPDWHLKFVQAIASRDVLVADEAARIHVRRGLNAELAALRDMGYGE